MRPASDVLQDIAKQAGQALSWFVGSEEEPQKREDRILREEERKYSAETLLGKERLAEITSLMLSAHAVYDNKQYHEQNILVASDLFVKAANFALAYIGEVSDITARNFLIKTQVLPLYGQASACYHKVIDEPGRYRSWHPLTIDIFRRSLELKSKCAAFELLVGMLSYYENVIGSFKHINYYLKKEFSSEQAGAVFIEAAKNAVKNKFPEVLVLQLYSFALEHLAAEFYDNNPSAEVVRLYQEAMEASIEIAVRGTTTEEGIQNFEKLQQEMSRMQDRLQLTTIIINEIESNPSIEHLNLGCRGLTDADIEQIVPVINRHPNIVALNLNRASRDIHSARDDSPSFKSSEMVNVFTVQGLIRLAYLKHIEDLKFGLQTGTVVDQAISAVLNGDLPTLQSLLTEIKLVAGQEVNNLLIVSVAFDRVEIFNYLLANGASINEEDGYTYLAALLAAKEAGHDEILLAFTNYFMQNLWDKVDSFHDFILSVATCTLNRRLKSMLSSIAVSTLSNGFQDRMQKVDWYLEMAPVESEETDDTGNPFRQPRWVESEEYKLDLLTLLDTISLELRGLANASTHIDFHSLCQWHDTLRNLASRFSVKDCDLGPTPRLPLLFSKQAEDCQLDGRSILALDEAAVRLQYYQLGVGNIKLDFM